MDAETHGRRSNPLHSSREDEADRTRPYQRTVQYTWQGEQSRTCPSLRERKYADILKRARNSPGTVTRIKYQERRSLQTR